MEFLEYGDKKAQVVLLQPVDEHDLETIPHEVEMIQSLTAIDFQLIAVKVDHWNEELSPWKAPAVFGREDFAGGAAATLKMITEKIVDTGRTYHIGGYSLAGLFALWAASRTSLFAGVAAASPSIWFPDFTNYIIEQKIKSKVIYLSLGDKEEKTKNPVMATVGDRIREAYEILEKQGFTCVLEWNQGNHFKEADLRMAKAFAWVLEHFEGSRESNT